MKPRTLDTAVVHGGERHKVIETPTVNPIYLSNTYTLEDPEEMDAILGGQRQGHTYSRHGSPTVVALSNTLKQLEGGEGAVLYSTGMAALQGALFATDLSPGDKVLANQDLYGATITLLKQILGSFGVETVVMDMSNTEAVESRLGNGNVKAIVFETISNPLLRVLDIPTLLNLANRHQAITIVDNTFATPYLCNPLSLGASMVVHSTTKYLNGHGDVMGGVVITNQDLTNKLTTHQKLTGAVLGGMEAWLIQRGVKTFVLRFERQLQNARELALRLDKHPAVRKVYHPSLPHHANHELATRLFPKGQGAVLSFEIHGGQAVVYRLMKSLTLVVPGTTVGDVYSLLLYPVMASHRSLSAEERAAAGITENLVRLSVGIENVEDIWADLNQALLKSST